MVTSDAGSEQMRADMAAVAEQLSSAAATVSDELVPPLRLDIEGTTAACASNALDSLARAAEILGSSVTSAGGVIDALQKGGGTVHVAAPGGRTDGGHTADDPYAGIDSTGDPYAGADAHVADPYSAMDSDASDPYAAIDSGDPYAPDAQVDGGTGEYGVTNEIVP